MGLAIRPHVSAHRAAVAAEVVTEHRGLAVDHGEETGAGPQQAGLAGPVGSLQEQDLALFHLEIDPRQRGKPAQQGDDGAEADGEGHGDPHTVPAGMRSLPRGNGLCPPMITL